MGWGLLRRPVTSRCSAGDKPSRGEARSQKQERSKREHERLLGRLAEQEKQLADHHKQIAEQQQQLEEKKEQIVDL